MNRLGFVLDKAKEYDRAYEAFRESNTVTKDCHPQYRGGFWYDRIYRNLSMATAENQQDWRQDARDDGVPAPVFLVGFPRSGTTLTERILSSHPDVTPSGEKPLVSRMIGRLNTLCGEGLGYPYNLNELTADQLAALRDGYWKLASDWCGARPESGLFLDKLPLNIIELCFIKRVFPEARIILLIRDPRDVCLSCFMQLFQPNDAMANFNDLESAARFYAAVMKLFARYEATLELNLVRIRYEDLVADMQGTVSGLLSFLGLDWDDRVLRYYQNRTYRVLTPSDSDTRKPIFSRAVGRWRNYRKYLQPILPHLYPHLQRYGYTGVVRIGGDPV